MYLLVVRRRDGEYNSRTKKTTWREWRDWGKEIFPDKQSLSERLTGRYRYVGDENEEFEVKYYKIDESTCVTVTTRIVIEEVK